MSHPLVEKEWRRLSARLRRVGVRKACRHVSDLVERGGYPIIFGIRLVEHLLKRGEFEAAGKIIEAVDRSGVRDPLMDDLHSSWLWCIGKHRAALSFAIKSAKFWNKSYTVHKVGTLYRCMANRENSGYYRRKSQHYWRLAHSLVELEERRDAKQKGNGAKRGLATALPRMLPGLTRNGVDS